MLVRATALVLALVPADEHGRSMSEAACTFTKESYSPTADTHTHTHICIGQGDLGGDTIRTLPVRMPIAIAQYAVANTSSTACLQMLV